jgi:uncharacterized protein (DUF2336 family)
MALTAQSLLADLDAALPQATNTWRSTAMRQIVDLFVSGADFYSGEQIVLFDAVMGRLAKNLDRARLAEVSHALAGVDNAPPKILTSLARHADIAVCGPVLEHGKPLLDSDLVAVAETDRLDPTALVKIASRGELSETVTDALLKRGNVAVRQKILDNPQARISEMGFARLVSSINGDKTMAAAIAARKEVPPELKPFLDAALSQ